MGAVGGAKCVVDIGVAHFCQLARQGFIAFGLAFQEAGIFEEEHLAGLEAGSHFSGFVAYEFRAKLHGAAQEFRQMRNEVAQGEFFDVDAAVGKEFVFRTAEVGHEDSGAPVAEDVVQGRNGSAHPRVVGDLIALVQRNVKIDAEEHFFVLEINMFHDLKFKGTWQRETGVVSQDQASPPA